MSTWHVNVEGQDRTVRMESPVTGRKIIFVDGVELKKVGSGISMWANYPLDLDGTPAVVKFRALKSFKGMSLYVDGQRIPPEPGGEMSAEEVQMCMLCVVVGAFLVYLFARGR